MSNSNNDKNESDFDWEDMIKKEARGYAKGDDLDEVQEIGRVCSYRERQAKEKQILRTKTFG